MHVHLESLAKRLVRVVETISESDGVPFLSTEFLFGWNSVDTIQDAKFISGATRNRTNHDRPTTNHRSDSPFYFCGWAHFFRNTNGWASGDFGSMPAYRPTTKPSRNLASRFLMLTDGHRPVTVEWSNNLVFGAEEQLFLHCFFWGGFHTLVVVPPRKK